MGKPISCVKKNPEEIDERNVPDDDEEDEDQSENYSDEFQQYRRIDHGHDQAVQDNQEDQRRRDNQNVLANQAFRRNQNDQENTATDEGTAGLSQASTAFLQDTPSPWSGRSSMQMSTVSSNPLDPNLLLPMVTLTTDDNQSRVLEPGGIVSPSITSRQHSDNEEHEERRGPRPILRKHQLLRKPAKAPESSSSASKKAKKWYKQMKGQIGTSLGKASSNAPKAKEIYKKIKSKFGSTSQAATSSSTGAKRTQYQADDAQPGPSGIRKSSSKSETSSRGSPSSKSRVTPRGKKKNDTSNERRLLGYNMSTRLQILRGVYSDPGLSPSYKRVSRRPSGECPAAERHSWTPGMLRDDSLELDLLSATPQRRTPLRSRPLTPSPSSPAPVPSRRSLTLKLPDPIIPSPPRSYCSPSSPLPQRRFKFQLSDLDIPAWEEILRSRSSNILHISGPSSPASASRALDLPLNPSQVMPEVPQEEPTLAIPALPQKKQRLPLPDLLPQKDLSHALPKISQKQLALALAEILPQTDSPPAMSEVPEASLPATPAISQETPSHSLPGIPQEEEVSQEFAPAIIEIPQEKPFTVMPEDFKVKQLVETPEVSQERPPLAMAEIPLEEQPLTLSKGSQKSVALPEVAQEEPTPAMLEIFQGEPSPKMLKVSQEKICNVPQGEPSFATTDISQAQQLLAVPEVSQEESMPAMPEIPLEEHALALSEVHPTSVPETIQEKKGPVMSEGAEVEQLHTMSEVSQKEPSSAIPEIRVEPSPPVLENRLEEPPPAIPEIRIAEPLLVPQEDPLPAIPVPHEGDASRRWLAVPESFHIDDSDHSSDSI